MKKTYCDKCGKAFDSWHQTSKYDIRIDDPTGFRWLDICDDCAEEFNKLLDNFLGSKEEHSITPASYSDPDDIPDEEFEYYEDEDIKKILERRKKNG